MNQDTVMHARRGGQWLLLLLFFVAAACFQGASHAAEPMLITDMQSFDARTGWVTDGRHLLMTLDGGAKWSDITPAAARGRIEKVFFTDPDQGWVASRSIMGGSAVRVFHTVDGGAHWQQLGSVDNKAADMGVHAVGMSFTGSSQGWLMLRVPSSSNFSFGRLFVSRDGGVSWRALPHPPAAGDVMFTSPDDGRLVATSGPPGTWVTHDGGVTWQELVNGNDKKLRRTQATASLKRHLGPVEAVVQSELDDAGQGWVLVAGGTCRIFKIQCTQHTRLLAVDGGRALDITPKMTFEGAQLQGVETLTNPQSQLGFDACTAPSTSAMDAWWNGTPWWWANIYIGGENRGCGQANLTSSWIDHVFATGWLLVPTWVGPQAPGTVCGGCSVMSSNSTTAYQQGINEANAAVNAAQNLGLDMPTIIYYDMERYESPVNNAAANAFINGWVKRLHDHGVQAGVYGSPYNLTYYWGISHVPDAVWIASWNGSKDVYNISGLPNYKWDNHRRLHQYRGDHNSTYNGVTLNIDTNSSDGPVANASGFACTIDEPILTKYQQLGGVNSVLGHCTSDTGAAMNGGKYNHFQYGSIYWSSATGAHELHGAISALWNGMHWEQGPLGYPVTDQEPTADTVGAYNDFEHGSIYWRPDLDAHAVMGAIYDRWQDLSWEQGVLGYPITNELPAKDGGVYNDFEHGSIYYSSATGAWEVMGAIYDAWAALQWENGFLGFPVTGELTTADGVGRYNEFQGGVIYWTPSTGAHEVHGAILIKWTALGREASCLGYPTSDEHTDGNGDPRSDFERGYITWSSTNSWTVVCTDHIFDDGFE